MRILLTLLPVLCILSSLSAQNLPEENQATKAPSDDFYPRGVEQSQPNVELPDHVSAAEGKLTLYADFEHADGDKVPLYLVNRTGKKQTFGSQDNDIYVRLEYQSADGIWIRAQTHRNSWCGNSYYSVELEPGQFFAFKGYHPGEGKSARVRYHSGQHSLVSNTGSGFYLEQDQKAASLDDMAANEIPTALGWMLRANDSFPFEFEKTNSGYLTALEMLSNYSESPYYRNEAKKMLEKVGPDSAEGKKIREILSRKWPAPAKETETLLQSSMANIRKGIEPTMSWNLIINALSNGHGFSGAIPDGFLGEVAKALPGALQSKKGQEAKVASKLLKNSSFANEWISTDSLLEWVKSEDPFVFAASARVLASRGKFAELTALGLKEETVERKVALLSFLASAGHGDGEQFYPRRPESDEEREFWKSCLENHPVESVSRLPRTYEDHNPYDRTVQAPLKKYLETVVEEMSSEPTKMQDLYTLSKLVRFFGKWRMEENVPVLEALLHHPGYIENEVSSSRDGVYLKRDFRIRRDAKAALHNMQKPVDPGLILEERVPLAGQHLEKDGENTKSGAPRDNPFGF